MTTNTVGVNTDLSMGSEDEQKSCDDKLDEECKACTQFFTRGGSRKPETLPCGHKFCTLCLLATVAGGALACPTCHTMHRYPLEENSAIGNTGEEKPPVALSQGKPINNPVKEEEKKSSKEASEERLRQLYAHQRMHQEQIAQLKTFIDQNKEVIRILDEHLKYVEEAEETGDVRKLQMELALNKLNAAETDEEIFAVMGEADYCLNDMSDWEQNFQQKQPELDAAIAKAAEVAKLHQDYHTVIEETNQLCLTETEKLLDESSKSTKPKMKTVLEEVSEEDQVSTAKGRKKHQKTVRVESA